LVEGLLAGEAWAWSACYDQYAGRLERFFQRHNVYLETDREDLFQESMIAIFSSLERFDPARGTFQGWVYGIARHIMLRGQREYASRYHKETVEEAAQSVAAQRLPPGGEVESDAAPPSSQVIKLRSTLKEMRPRDQEILVLRQKRSETPWITLADELGLSESAAKMRHKRALDRLRERMGAPIA
jgi:RNA polymerase sigma-70 factor (ECF subfamily)